MKCPKCDSKETRVSCTEHKKEFTKRYCHCLECKYKFRTKETYTDKIGNPGLVKDSFILNNYQCEMIKKNKYMLDRREWATIYNVSVSTIIKAENKFVLSIKKRTQSQEKMDFLYKAKNTLVLNSGNKGQP